MACVKLSYTQAELEKSQGVTRELDEKVNTLEDKLKLFDDMFRGFNEKLDTFQTQLNTVETTSIELLEETVTKLGKEQVSYEISPCIFLEKST